MTVLSNRFCTFVSQMQSAKNTRVDPRVDSISEIGRAQTSYRGLLGDCSIASLLKVINHI